MNSNPYTPPTARVSDLRETQDVGRGRSAAIVIAVTIASALGGFIAILSGIALIANRNQDGNWKVIFALMYGLLSIGCAVAMHKRVKSVGVLWCVLCGLLLFFGTIGAFASKKVEPISVVMLGFLILQFLASLVAALAIKRATAVA